MIEFFIDGKSFGSTGSGFSIFQRYENQIWKRAINCGKITGNQTEFKALLYGLTSIKKEFQGERVIVYTKNKYVQLMLQRTNGAWEKPLESIEKNQDLIGQVRIQMERFGDITIICDPEQPLMAEAKLFTEEMIKSGLMLYPA